MDSDFITKAVIGAAVYLFFNFGSGFLKKLVGEVWNEPTPLPTPLPPPIPRQGRRRRNVPLPEPETVAPAPVAAVHLDDTSLVVTRPARAQSRTQFRGLSALRRAIVAREVLGPPLSLRRPRY